MHRRGLLAAALLSAVVTTVTGLGPTGPVAAAASNRIEPGTRMVTGAQSCTANFVFRDARHRLFVGYAATCATRKAAIGGNACSARSKPLGTRVRFANLGHTVGHGVLRYSSLRAMRRAGVTDSATCAANDFALVQVRGAVRRRVVATMPYWGGPAGMASLPTVGSTVFGLARSSASMRTLPRVGQLVAISGSTATVTTALPSTRAARGSGFLDDAGHAVGILTRSTTTGANTVVSLATAVSFARHHRFGGLHVVRGKERFTGSAIL